MTAAALPSHRRPHRLRASLLSSSLLLLLFLPAWLSLVLSHTPTPVPRPSPLPLISAPTPSTPLSVHHIVFCIASSAELLPSRLPYLRLWWRPHLMRGHIWLDRPPASPLPSPSPSLPPILLSQDTSGFRYTHPTGHPSGLRIARVIAESFRLAHPDARWFVLCDDDTIVSPDNLVSVLARHDWTEMLYVGTPSESHSANSYFSHAMAYGGAGIAVSYPLARMLADTLDACIERYPDLYGSDDRLHACVSELGVPITHEPGFHQWDIRGSAHGLLATHPIAPFVSIHHVETVDPIYPGLNSLESLELFAKAMIVEERSFLQRSICYDHNSKLTFAVSIGYVVQVFANIVLPRELERSEQTYLPWNGEEKRDEFDFDTKDVYKSTCKMPILFFLKDVAREGEGTTSSYLRAKGGSALKRKVFCFLQSPPIPEVNKIQIRRKPLSKNWHLVPRRLCCKVNQVTNGTLEMNVSQCGKQSLGSVADSL